MPDTTFDDVKGLEDVKKLVKSFLFMAQNPDVLKYYKLEGGLGMLMYGAPGTGKTMFAEAIANAMNLPLFIVTPADIFKSYVGESEQAVKQIFQEIDACPEGAILFVDECESIFSRRTQDTKDYKAAVTTELLQRINGFGVDGSKRIMIAATNRPDVIDPAYLRYKRFSHLIHVTPPDLEAKRAIIESKLSGIALDGVTAEDARLSRKPLSAAFPCGTHITPPRTSAASWRRRAASRSNRCRRQNPALPYRSRAKCSKRRLKRSRPASPRSFCGSTRISANDPAVPPYGIACAHGTQ